MSDETDAMGRFARDLAGIREDRGMTIEEIHRELRLPQSFIESFEAGALDDRPNYNRVYLRSFVRAYAGAIGLSEDEVAEHLEAALQGTYQNELAVRYRNVPPVKGEESGSSASKEKEASPPKDEARQVWTEGEKPSATNEDSAGSSGKGSTKGLSSPDPSSDTVAEPPDGSSVASSSLGSTSSSSLLFSEESPLKVLPSDRRTTLRTGIGVLVLLGLLLAVGFLYYGGDESTGSGRSSESAVPGPSPPDSSSVAAGATSSRGEKEPSVVFALGDTLHVTVLANSPIREMRVRRDEDLRRPYWIEEGEAVVFPFTQRITIENQLSRAQFYLEQYPYPASRRDSQGAIVIDPEVARAFGDTLRGAPASLSVAPDTIPLRGPPSAGAIE